MNEHEQEILGLENPFYPKDNVVELLRQAQQQNYALQEQLSSPLRGESGAARSELPRSLERVDLLRRIVVYYLKQPIGSN